MARAETSLDGVLRVDKPAGPTSHDVVAAARRALGTRRIGHTGTLDPFASGLLLLCVGRATRVAEYLTGLDKRYEAAVRLGVATDTDDHTGAPIATVDAAGVTREDVERALAPLRGTVLQVPPQYSAKKRGGERAYAAARQGRVVELEAVTVHVGELELSTFEPPDLELVVTASSGTYIRAIARDLGAALGTGAHLTALRRTAIGPHRVGDALTLDELAVPGRARAALVPSLESLGHLPRHDLDAAAAEDIRHGRAVPAGTNEADAPVVTLAAGGVLLAIAERSAGTLRPRKVLA